MWRLALAAAALGVYVFSLLSHREASCVLRRPRPPVDKAWQSVFDRNVSLSGLAGYYLTSDFKRAVEAKFRWLIGARLRRVDRNPCDFGPICFIGIHFNTRTIGINADVPVPYVALEYPRLLEVDRRIVDFATRDPFGLEAWLPPELARLTSGYAFDPWACHIATDWTPLTDWFPMNTGCPHVPQQYPCSLCQRAFCLKLLSNTPWRHTEPQQYPPHQYPSA